MEEIIQSANNVEVAETQTETQETSVNTSEVADPKPVQDAETNAHYAEMRRSNEYRQQAETYQQQLNRIAQFSGYQSHDEFLKALDEAEQAQQRQQYEDAGINPDVLNQFLENHPDMQYAREMRAKEQEQQQLHSEIDQLREQFPDLKPEELTDELFAIKEQRKVPLLHAYLELNFQKLAQQKEQEAIQKLQNNASSTPGSLGAGAEHKTGYSNLSDADKKALRERVLRGENVQL